MIDHIIYADPDLDRAVRTFAREYGVSAAAGGVHRGFGTRNALIGLGQAYLELVGIDPEQNVAPAQRLFGLDDGSRPGFVAWCARSPRTLQETRAIARAEHCDLGEIMAMSRERPDGSTISWTLTSPHANRCGVLPFYIDWGDAPTPAASLPPLLTLISLTLLHPEPDRIRAILDALGEDQVDVKGGSRPSLLVELRR
jgi:hypothetical protein